MNWMKTEDECGGVERPSSAGFLLKQGSRSTSVEESGGSKYDTDSKKQNSLFHENHKVE